MHNTTFSPNNCFKNTVLCSNLSELRIVVLDHMCISHCDSSLKVICPSIEELDISSNLFVSWDEVANTTIQLPKLSALNVR